MFARIAIEFNIYIHMVSLMLHGIFEYDDNDDNHDCTDDGNDTDN